MKVENLGIISIHGILIKEGMIDKRIELFSINFQFIAFANKLIEIIVLTIM